ncbi:MAG: hypothetical protein HN802_01195 [Candidatus Jacksonbacteria bacterium]|jgi:hypothetical protein|nr:hypothetical protein [Candidatus Jacksonbacteria bacterium]
MSKKKKKNYEIIGDGEICKCGKPMQRREKIRVTDKMKSGAYYYKEYDYCVPCKRIVLYDHHKVMNSKGHLYEEINRQNDFIKSI